MIETPLIAALITLAVAALLVAIRSFQLLYRDFRPKYRGRHRFRRTKSGAITIEPEEIPGPALDSESPEDQEEEGSRITSNPAP